MDITIVTETPTVHVDKVSTVGYVASAAYLFTPNNRSMPVSVKTLSIPFVLIDTDTTGHVARMYDEPRVISTKDVYKLNVDVSHKPMELGKCFVTRDNLLIGQSEVTKYSISPRKRSIVI